MEISRIPVIRNSTEKNCHYDVFLGVIGFEDRSSFVAKQYKNKFFHKLAINFKNREEHSFSANKKWHEDNNFVELDVNQFTHNFLWSSYINENSKEAISILVDISSMSRSMLAKVLSSFSRVDSKNLSVTFAYAPAKFTPPPTELSPIEYFGPVTDDFAGWTTNPELPTSTIIGLGYEYDKALGTIEYLEPDSVWAFYPIGLDDAFERAVRKANRDFFRSLPPEKLIPYRIDQPNDLFMQMESLIYGQIGITRPIFVPFGPKIFALTSMLVSQNYPKDSAVWRVSGEQSEQAVNYIASGEIIFLEATYLNKSTDM